MVCTNRSEADKKYGKEMSEKIHQRIQEITAAESVEIMIQFRIGKCHPLKGNLKGQYAVCLVEPYRLVFKVMNLETQIVDIQGIGDYH